MKFVALIAFSAAVFGTHASAATVFKCVDEAGKVTFTQQNCPKAEDFAGAVSAHNPVMSGDGPVVQMAPVQRSQTSGLAGAKGTMGVSKPSAQRAKCSTGLNDQDLRTAKVRGEVVPGMSRDEIEQMYDKPGRNGGARGAGASTYWNDKYIDQTTIRYDSNGCVSSSYQSGSARKP